MAFEVFQKGSAPAPQVPSVTIQKKGLFSINEAAQKLIGYPEAIQFLWDSERRLIALRPVPLSAPNAYPTRHQGTSSGKQGRGPVLAAGTLFTRHIGLDTSRAQRWTPRLEDGMLLIDLKEEGQVVVANRSKNRSKLDSDTSAAGPTNA